MAIEGRLRDYSARIAQIDGEIKENLIFRICPNSVSLLASRYDMSNKRGFPIGGIKKQHDAIL